jgi:Xaa-Pro aminopeptidase
MRDVSSDFHATGSYGIRIENVVVVREVKTPNNFGDKGYLGFEHVTMSPSQFLRNHSQLSC